MQADSPAQSPPAGASSDWTIDQGWRDYSAEDHRVWLTLYERQAELLPGRACDPFLKGLDALDLHGRGIPDFNELNEKLRALTGWSVVAVPGLVPDEVFFDHLANRRFPAGRFIRKPDQLDYLEEPDVFHDVFGHVPMLTDPVFADYMQAYGQGGLRAMQLGRLHNLAGSTGTPWSSACWIRPRACASTARASSRRWASRCSASRTRRRTAWASTWCG